jgi:hypothetical protein
MCVSIMGQLGVSPQVCVFVWKPAVMHRATHLMPMTYTLYCGAFWRHCHREGFCVQLQLSLSVQSCTFSHSESCLPGRCCQESGHMSAGQQGTLQGGCFCSVPKNRGGFLPCK